MAITDIITRITSVIVSSTIVKPGDLNIKKP